MLDLPIWIVLAGIATVCAAALVKLVWRFPGRSIDDVIPYIVPVDLGGFAVLVDPLEEARLRSQMSGREFRRAQRKRVHLAWEYLRRMSRNALILAQWASSERLREARDQETAFLRHELLNSAVEVRFCALLAQLKLGFWIMLRIEVWPLLPSPSISDLKDISGIEAVHAYQRLKTAASYLSLSIGSAYHDQLVRGL